MHILLASKSPRRRELLAQLGIPFSFVDIDIDEHIATPLPASQVAESLALLKAGAFSAPIAEDQVLLTADTVVVHREQVLGKPHSRQEAVTMLQSLSGCAHQVYTGVCLRNARRTVSFTECTQVHFRPLAMNEINYYVDKYQPFDKAGSYGIQEWVGMVGIERIEGCFYNVMGLPVSRLYTELQRFVDSHQPLIN